MPYQFSKSKSFSFIQPALRKSQPKRIERAAGSTIQRSGIPTQRSALLSVEDIIPIGPTSPQVPIPALTPVHLSLNTIVERGPIIAPASVGGIQMRGFLQILP